MRSYLYSLKRHFPFTREEKKAILISILVLTFITGFNDGSKTFDLNAYLTNYLFALIMVTVTFFVHQIGYRLLGIKVGFRVEYQLWWYGLLAAVIVCLVTNGRILLLIPGGFIVHHLDVGRLWRFRYGINVFPVAMIALMGALASILFGTLLKQLNIWIFDDSMIWMNEYFTYNLLFAALNLLPIPPLDGSRILFNSRLVYAFLFGAFASYWFLAWLGFYSYIVAIIIGAIVWIAWFVKVET